MIFRKNQSRNQIPGDELPRPRYESISESDKERGNNSQLPRICATLSVFAFLILNWKSNAGFSLDALTYNMITGAIVGGVGALIGTIINALLRGWVAWVVLIAAILLGAVGYHAYIDAHPNTVANAEKEAVKWNPELGVPNSPLNREFVARYNRYQVTNKEFFKDPRWPLRLVAECKTDMARSKASR